MVGVLGPVEPPPTRLGGVFTQHEHSANYYGVYPGNTPENHPPTEVCMINSEKNPWCTVPAGAAGCRVQDPGAGAGAGATGGGKQPTFCTAHGAPPYGPRRTRPLMMCGVAIHLREPLVPARPHVPSPRTVLCRIAHAPAHAVLHARPPWGVSVQRGHSVRTAPNSK